MEKETTLTSGHSKRLDQIARASDLSDHKEG